MPVIPQCVQYPSSMVAAEAGWLAPLPMLLSMYQLLLPLQLGFTLLGPSFGTCLESVSCCRTRGSA